MGIRVGIREGAIPGTTPAPREEGPDTAKRAPEALQGPEWVVSGAGRVTGGWTGIPHPAGPVGLARQPSLGIPSECRLLANRGEINGHFL